MNFIYAIFLCHAGACDLYGASAGYRAPGINSPSRPAPVYQTLEACQAAKLSPPTGYDFECFKEPTWTYADEDNVDDRERRELSKPGPEAPSSAR